MMNTVTVDMEYDIDIDGKRVFCSMDNIDTDIQNIQLQRIKVRDGGRIVAFTGIKLAGVSSARVDAPRWTQITIYRSDAGRYIVNRVGVSIVAHTIDCPQVMGKTRYGIDKLRDDEAQPDQREPCTLCRPNIDTLMHTDPASLTFEHDRSWTAVCEDAQSLIEALHTSRHGVRTLVSLASNAIADAAMLDPVIAAAYNTVTEV